MKTYKLILRGTKKNNTPDLEVELKGDSKSQAFNFAYAFFQTGEYNSSTAKYHWKLTDFIPDAANLDQYVGKYFVPRSAVQVVK
jgi:hypothetical protein